MADVSSPFVRVYIDLPRDVNTQLDVMVAHAQVSKKKFLADLVMAAAAAQLKPTRKEKK